MKKAIIYGVLLLSFYFIGANAAIIEGRGVLQMNTAINFTSKHVFQPIYEKQSPYHREYPCSLSIDSADIFFLSHDCGLCMYYCPCELIGSVRPFFVLKKPLNSLLMAGALNLRDISSLAIVDSSGSCFNRDTVNCYLPSIIYGFGQGSCGKIDWSLPLIAVTLQRRYVLIEMNITTAQSCDPTLPGSCHTYTSAVNLHWFLQTDGTPNFQGVTAIAQENNLHENAEVSYNSSRVITGELFDLLGRKVPASEVLHKKTYGMSNLKLFISDKNNTAKILFIGK
jgi:hypothetical protein